MAPACLQSLARPVTWGVERGARDAVVPPVALSMRYVHGHVCSSRATWRGERVRIGRLSVVNTRAALRALAVSVWALATGAVGGAPAPFAAAVRGGGPTAPASARSRPEQAMFAFLTAGSWCGESCFDTTSGPFGSCGAVRFRPDGTFLWTVESDYSEVLAEGAWDLTLENATSGRVRVGGAREYVFERRGEE